MCRSTNHGSRVSSPEVWFRIVHIALGDQSGAPVAACEQSVEIALGPKGAFENGNIATFTRRLPSERVLSAVPPLRGKPRSSKKPKKPRVVELLRKAIEWQALLKSGEAASQTEIARRDGITRARVTQVMSMLRLAPEIQQHILSMGDMVRRPAITERALRPVVKIEERKQQLAAFSALLDSTATESLDARR